MFDKKKLNFWRLAVIFMGFTAVTLISLWLSPQEKKASMMNESMANMASMHLEGITIYDLVGSSDTDAESSNSSSTSNSASSSQVTAVDSSHSHDAGMNEVNVLGIITTIIIFALIPLLICGIIILAIVWIK